MSCIFSAITFVPYNSAHIRLEIAAPLGSSFIIRAARLVDDTLIRSIPFKFLSSHASHCPKASLISLEGLPADANIAALFCLEDTVLEAHAAPARTAPRKP